MTGILPYRSSWWSEEIRAHNVVVLADEEGFEPSIS
jgi:hypothetical protein